jgi:mono/diheme cytochrome c family protein
MSRQSDRVFELHQFWPARAAGPDASLTQINGAGGFRARIKNRLKSTSRAMRNLIGGLAVFLVMTGSALAITPAEQRGKNFVRTNCSGCHAIDKVSPSPLTIAPPFRDLHRKYPIESLQESLAEGIYTGHPTMPTFRLDPDQINDVLSYLKSLE